MGKYIKVTNPKTQESVVVLASNASFLKSQGYVVSEPSEEEIQVSFPEEVQLTCDGSRTTICFYLKLKRLKLN
jgi:hypothetical protein